LTYRALVLFDIDGTLVRRAGPHHREALCVGIHRHTGIRTTTDGIPVQGMLDPDILTVMLRREGIKASRIRELLPDIQRSAENYYIKVCPPLEDKHCPGVADVLQRLSRRGNLLGLVTGNLARIARRKLFRSGLWPYFCFGAYAEMAKTRGGLVKIAVKQARTQKWIEPDAPVSLVGDAPQDIIAARENGIRSIAVKTGITPVEELEAERPDFLLKDLRELRLRMVE
jgi:phosphoglycolate phosphatase